MSVIMRKRGCRDTEVHDDAAKRFEADGWAVVGEASKAEPAPVEEDNSDSGLTEAEKSTEIEARCNQVRADGESKGLEEMEIEADVEAERSRAELELA